MNAEEAQVGVENADYVRAELYDTLGQLRDRLNFAQRIDNRIDRARVKVSAMQLENPVKYAACVAGVAATVGVAVWGIANSIVRRSS